MREVKQLICCRYWISFLRINSIDRSIVSRRLASRTRRSSSSSEIMAPRKRSHLRRKPEERANVSTIFISPEPEAINPKWFITAAATNHMTSDKSIFSDLKPMVGLVIGDRAGVGAGLPMHGIGAVDTWQVVLPDVWYVPEIYCSLVSASQLTANGLKTEIAGDVCTVARADGSVVGKGRMISDGIYEVDFLRVPLN